MTEVRQPGSDSQRELRGILRSGRTALLSVGVFSLVSNMLLLAIPLYTLQVYDRVLNSKSLPTLFGLFLLVTVMLIFNGVIDLVRSRIVTRIALDVDRRIGMTTFNAVNRLSLNHGRSAAHVLRDVDTVRQFIASPAPLAFFDAPWAVIFLLVLFALHWSLGVVATVGGIVLVVLAVMTDRMTRALFAETDKAAIKANEMAEASNRNAEAMFGLGMSRSYADRWQEAKWETLRLQTATNDRISTMTTLSKGVRMFLQMVVVTVGATLAIGGSITIGTIIAASILLGRALAPVEQVVGQWRSFGAFRRSYAKVDELLKLAPSFADKVQLPPMEGRLQAVGARVAPPAARQLVVNGATFEVEPGQLLAIVGPSGSGKSSLARAIVGLWPVVAGELRIDGARPDQWNVEQFGRSIGYLPQGMELFAGTVAANIARFDPEPDMDEVIAAAQAANAHEMILKLPGGYETELSSFADNLSGGQRQRIALARALYGDPALLVLDEPNSNLDQAGEEALRIVLDAAKARRKTVVVVTHRMSIVQHDDLVLALHSGQQIAFGTREDVIRRLTPAPPAPPAPQQVPRTQRAAIGAPPLPLRWDGSPDRNAKPNGGA